MKQVVIIHGGDSFSSYEAYIDNLKSSPIDYERLKPRKKWSQWIAEQMPEADVLMPSMPNGNNAVYEEWKIYFEKILPFLNDDVRLVGHSLGAMFLAIYLNDNPLPQPVRQLVLVAGRYGEDTLEDRDSFSVLSASNVYNSANDVYLFHSEDDPIVPFAELAKFQHDIPSAVLRTFNDRNHFLQPTFPELLEILKQK